VQNAPPTFRFTSIQVNKNSQSSVHVDGNNVGPSRIVALGDYRAQEGANPSGGCLWVQGQGPLDCHESWKQFDGTDAHCTVVPYEGTRYTLICFTTIRWDQLGATRGDRPPCEGGTPEAVARMTDEWNFPLPDQPMSNTSATRGGRKQREQAGQQAYDEWERSVLPAAEEQQYDDGDDGAAGQSLGGLPHTPVTAPAPAGDRVTRAGAATGLVPAGGHRGRAESVTSPTPAKKATAPVAPASPRRLAGEIQAVIGAAADAGALTIKGVRAVAQPRTAPLLTVTQSPP
jgi:hypothetical protein